MVRVAVLVAVLVGGGFGWVFMTSCSSSGGEAALPTGPPIRIFLADLDASQFEVGFDLIINSGDIEVLSLSDSPVLRSTIRLARCRVLVRREEILVDDVPFGKQVRLASSARSGFRVGGIRVGGVQDDTGGWRGVLDLIFYQGQSGGRAKLRLINELNLEEYIAGVVGKEMGGDRFPLEALKAQAVAARTYTLYNLKKRLDLYGRMPLADAFPRTIHFQSYGGIAAETPKILRATRETSGKVLTHGGRMFQAFYHSTCGGRTAAGAYFGEQPDTEPLQGGFCENCRSAPHYEWKVEYALQDLGDVLRSWAQAHDVAMGDLHDVVPTETLEGGHSQYLKIVHADGSFEILTEQFRSLSGRNFESPVRSSRFEVDVDRKRNRIRFEGRGYGHGVGLCQYGAGERARQNEAFGEILGFYYPKSGLMKVY